MVKSKQTSKKSTGGIAPRVILKLPIVGATSLPETEVINVCERFRHNDFCIICRDGSVDNDFLYMCDQCPRSMCSHCMDILPAHAQAASQQGVTFVCICCHIAREKDVRGSSQSPYFGFYLRGKPLFEHFLPIRATLEVSHRAQISSDSVLFVHLTLIDNDATGGPFQFAYKFLLPYFPRGGIEYCEIVFDFGNDTKITKFQATIGEIINKLSATGRWKRIVFGISNHTDNTNGDPFAGYASKKKSYVATRIDNFLDIVLKPFKALINHASESHELSAAIAFNAVRFQPSFASHLLLSFTEHVIIERFPIQKAFPEMLGQSYKLGRHSDVFLMTKKGASLDVSKFSWTHAQLRPWGHYLPVQCPQCGWADAWDSANHQKVYSFECKNRNCKKSFIFSQPTNMVRTLTPGRTGISCWIELCL
ncbi:hypothetical protein BDR04DRAFT_1164718 [Suillus decipiens]|nr:hypothetical protein BDR04DRAFT_1164718 [Suillus decipiens]